MLKQELAISDATLTLFEDVWTAAESQALFAQLQHLDWQQKTIKMFGRDVMQPRLVAWYGDAGADYRYSGVLNRALPWTPVLNHIRERVQAVTQRAFNSVLCNYYRDGQDSVGWHSDDETELGEKPIIASVSFGVMREFCLQHRKHKTARYAIALPDASVLLMAGETQKHYRHAVLKNTKISESRINLTFRMIGK